MKSENIIKWCVWKGIWGIDVGGSYIGLARKWSGGGGDCVVVFLKIVVKLGWVWLLESIEFWVGMKLAR